MPSGLYSILYFDSTETRSRTNPCGYNGRTLRGGRSRPRFRVSRELELAGEASEAAFALELERSNFKVEDLHGRSALVADSIALFRSFHQAMGASNSQDYKIRKRTNGAFGRVEQVDDDSRTQLAFG